MIARVEADTHGDGQSNAEDVQRLSINKKLTTSSTSQLVGRSLTTQVQTGQMTPTLLTREMLMRLPTWKLMTPMRMVNSLEKSGNSLEVVAKRRQLLSLGKEKSSNLSFL